MKLWSVRNIWSLVQVLFNSYTHRTCRGEKISIKFIFITNRNNSGYFLHFLFTNSSTASASLYLHFYGRRKNRIYIIQKKKKKLKGKRSLLSRTIKDIERSKWSNFYFLVSNKEDMGMHKLSGTVYSIFTLSVQFRLQCRQTRILVYGLYFYSLFVIVSVLRRSFSFSYNKYKQQKKRRT